MWLCTEIVLRTFLDGDKRKPFHLFWWTNTKTSAHCGTNEYLAIPATFLLLWPSRNKASRSYLWRKNFLGPQFDQIELIMEKVWQQSLGLVVFIILDKSQNAEIKDSKWARLKTSRPASQWFHGGRFTPFHIQTTTPFIHHITWGLNAGGGGGDNWQNRSQS